MSSLHCVLGCDQINFADVFLTCKKQDMQSLQAKKIAV